METARPELRLKTRLLPIPFVTDNQWTHLTPPDMTTVKDVTVAIITSTECQASHHITPTGEARATTETRDNIESQEATVTKENADFVAGVLTTLGIHCWVMDSKAAALYR